MKKLPYLFVLVSLLAIIVAPFFLFKFSLLSFVMSGILLAILLNNFTKAQTKAKNSVVKSNMQTVQAAIEAYAKDHGGKYPLSIDELLKTYFPGGEPKKSPGEALLNPFTRQKEWPVMGDLKSVSATKMGDLLPTAPGSIQYSCICDEAAQPTAYAITGGDNNGLSISDYAEVHPLVLTNQSALREE